MIFKTWIGAILGISALILRKFAIQYPAITEVWYSRIIFPKIRVMVDHTLGYLPFPIIYIFILGLVFFFILTGRKIRMVKGRKSKGFYVLRTASNFLGFFVFLFLVLWGFNYHRISVFQQLSLSAGEFSEQDLLAEMDYTNDQLSSLRDKIQTDTLELEAYFSFHELKGIVAEEMEKSMQVVGIPYNGKPSVRELYPSGWMRRMGIFGIYFPFTGEGYLDPSLHPLEKAFTLAHEMAHGFGITDEGEANFIGWMTCGESNEPLLQYAGHIKLFRYQLNDLYRINPAAYGQFVKKIHAGVRNDLLAIRENNLSIRPLFLELSKKSNDLYLKSQGVKAGIQSYTQLPRLARAWRQRNLVD